MSIAADCFWACAAIVAYAYAGYPLLLLASSRLRRRPERLRGEFHGSVSVIMSAYNEARRVAARRDELAALIETSGLDGELLIVSDGSTDGTAAAARQGAPPFVRVLELPANVGKAEALNRGRAASRGDILVFADVRQRWAPDALVALLSNFADPRVGGATGELCLESAPGVAAAVGAYWRYEKRIRRLESRIHSPPGATGAISAVRRELYRLIPPGTVLDDVWWPMHVVMQGYRIVHDGTARAFDRLPERPKDEFRRKVRTLSGNFQLVARCPALLWPPSNPIWIQFVSHKLVRLAVPWMLLLMLITSGVAGSMPYGLAFLGQLGFYAAALAGMRPGVARRSKVAAICASFVLLNVAAFLGFWIWASGRATSSWRKARYEAASNPARSDAIEPRARDWAGQASP